MSAEKAILTKDTAKQREGETSERGGSVTPERSRSGDGGNKGQAALSLVLVPVEPVTEGEPSA